MERVRRAGLGKAWKLQMESMHKEESNACDKSISE